MTGSSEAQPATWRTVVPDQLEWRSAWRSARRQPLVSATVVVALATGIALATAGFGFLSAVLWGELPFPQGDRFVRLRTFTPQGERGEVEPARYRFLRERGTSMAYLGALATGSFNVVLPDGDVEAVDGARLTPGWFAYAGYAPVAGRTLIVADGRAGAPAVAVVRESFWRRRLGADPAAIGRQLRVGGERITIVGVAPDAYGFPGNGELWLAADELEPRGEIRVAGVLADGASLDSAAAELEGLSARFDAAHAPHPTAESPRLGLQRAADLSGSGIDVALTLLLGLLLLVLLLVASNVANLTLARAAARAGELSVRVALGASRLQLARQLVAEVLLLGSFAAVIGAAGAQAILGWLERKMAGDDLPFWFDFGFSPATALFVAAITIGACAVAGALPALRATADPARRLASSARAGDRFSRGAALAIVGEMALAVALAASALAIARGAALATASGGALPARQVATAQLSFDGQRATARREAALDAVRAANGVVAAGAGTSLPYLSAGTERVEVERDLNEDAAAARRMPVVGVSVGYLEALTANAVAGRLFAAADFAAGAAPVAVVNALFVERFLGGRSPLGRRLRVDRGDGELAWREIVGVVPELGLGAGDPDLGAGVYLPLDDEQSSGLLFLAARSAGDSAALATPLRRALFAHDPELSVRRVQPLEAVADDDRSALAVFATVLSGVGAIALLLSLLGIYAVVSFRVARRTREIAVRVALGATERQVTRLVVGGASRLFVLGALAGSLLAWGLLAVRAAIFVARFPGPGPWLFPGVVAALGAAGVAACWTPVRRALAVEPARALQSE